jgi:hypothetical protein
MADETTEDTSETRDLAAELDELKAGLAQLKKMGRGGLLSKVVLRLADAFHKALGNEQGQLKYIFGAVVILAACWLGTNISLTAEGVKVGEIEQTASEATEAVPVLAMPKYKGKLKGKVKRLHNKAKTDILPAGGK